MVMQIKISNLRDRVNKLNWHLDYIRKKKQKSKDSIDTIKSSLALMQEGSILVAKAVEDTHKSLETSVIQTVNQALRLVFDEPYEMSLKVIQRGTVSKTSSVRIVLKENGVEVEKNLQECVCGGQLVVISIILRIAFILLNPDDRRILLLDEALGSLSRVADEQSESNLQKAVKMLEKLSEKFKIQMLIITHTGANE